MVEEEILFLDFSGHLSERVGLQAVTCVREVLTVSRTRVILTNMVGVTRVDASSRSAGREILHLVKSHGIRESFCATSLSVVRVVGAAMVLAVGMRVWLFPTIDEALAAAKLAVRRRA